jgi:agmatine/peptidylarginine deiminase
MALDAPSMHRPEYADKDFATVHINFHLANATVFMPKFGDPVSDAVPNQKLSLKGKPC